MAAQTHEEQTNKNIADEDLKQKWSDFVRSFSDYDPRFPNTNQTRNCKRNYIDYHACLHVKDGDEDYCKWYKQQFQSICPDAWIERWDEQREKGIWAPASTFPKKSS